MGIRKYKPTTNGLRGMSTLTNTEITATVPEKSLLVSKSKTGGRNNQGKTTVRDIGGGAKRKYRIIDFKEINLIFLLELLQLNMIQTEQQILLY